MAPSDDVFPLPGPSDVSRHIAALELASDEFAPLLRRYGRPSPALRHHGLIQWQRADPAGAVVSFRAALGLTPDDPDLWRDLAGAYEGAGRSAAAEACVRAALRHRSEDARSWLVLAQLRNRAGDHDQAVEGFNRALALDPTCGDAHFALGLIAFARKDLDAALAHLRSALDHGYANALGFAAFGHALYGVGRFGDCAAAFEDASRFGPLDQSSARKHAQARTFATIIDGRLEQAIADYPALPGADRAGPATVLREAFSALSGYGYPHAAAQVGRMRLAQDPEDPTQRYLLEAVTGGGLSRAPLDYIESHFDGFAESFDQKLIEVLLYAVPQTLAQFLAEIRGTFTDMLDLGCGTGLAAAHLAGFGGRLSGVDLSRRMLEQAEKRQLYGDLVKGEAIDFLARHPSAFDLVFAADVVNYFGDLQPLLAAAAGALRSEGLFAFSIETMAGDGFRLQPSGRFTHAIPYVEGLAAPGFVVVARRSTTLRIEAGRPCAGCLLVLARAGGVLHA